jgi:hypothetical protein
MEYVIGIGSQRAGSTLLHRLLQASTDIFMHPVKELHYFDTLYGYRDAAALSDFSFRQLAREVNHIVGAKAFDFIDQNYRCYLRTNLILSKTPIQSVQYHDLFRPMLSRRQLFGEVTPEYMLLDDASIEKMKSVVGENARIILLCRHPVDRIISSAKLFNVYNNQGLDDAALNAWLLSQAAQETAWMKTQDAYNDYAGTIERYSRHFKRFVALRYDDLISDPATQAQGLIDKLDLSIDVAAFVKGLSSVVNSLGESSKIQSELKQALDKRYEQSLKYYEGKHG